MHRGTFKKIAIMDRIRQHLLIDVPLKGIKHLRNIDPLTLKLFRLRCAQEFGHPFSEQKILDSAPKEELLEAAQAYAKSGKIGKAVRLLKEFGYEKEATEVVCKTVKYHFRKAMRLRLVHKTGNTENADKHETTARELGKQYGLSEEEIDSILNDAKKMDMPRATNEAPTMGQAWQIVKEHVSNGKFGTAADFAQSEGHEIFLRYAMLQAFHAYANLLQKGQMPRELMKLQERHKNEVKGAALLFYEEKLENDPALAASVARIFSLGEELVQAAEDKVSGQTPSRVVKITWLGRFKELFDFGRYKLAKNLLAGEPETVVGQAIEHVTKAYSSSLNLNDFGRATKIAAAFLDKEHVRFAIEKNYEYSFKTGRFGNAARIALALLAELYAQKGDKNKEEIGKWELHAASSISRNIEKNREICKGGVPRQFCNIRLGKVPRNILDMLLEKYRKNGTPEDVLKLAVCGNAKDAIAEPAIAILETQLAAKDYLKAWKTAFIHLNPNNGHVECSIPK